MEKEKTCRDCRGWFWCMEASRLYPCKEFKEKARRLPPDRAKEK